MKKRLLKLKINYLLKKVSYFLKSKGIQNPVLEARLLISYVKNISNEKFFILSNYLEVSIQEIKKLREACLRRGKGEPLAYITQNQEFFAYNFFVNKSVLIPRADTEVLVKSIITENQDKKSLSILDLGTGSGCIILSILKQMPNATGFAVDISKKALKVCYANAKKMNLLNKITIKKSNWYSNINFYQKFDIIASNPPYISLKKQKKLLSPGVFFEPKIALFSKGNTCYEKILKGGKHFLKKNGYIYLEIGKGNKTIENINNNNSLILQKKYLDIQGIVRVLKFRKI